jgi:hypothetical protein
MHLLIVEDEKKTATYLRTEVFLIADMEIDLLRPPNKSWSITARLTLLLPTLSARYGRFGKG